MAADALKGLFSRPEDDDKVQRSWTIFQRAGGLPADCLRQIVGDSWQRCLTAQVDPGRHNAPITLRAKEVPTLLHQYRELLDASRPVMSLARDFLSETGTVMVLTDSNGTVLDVEGDSRTLTPAENVHLLPGAIWSEIHCGTNAIGTALSLEQPVQIHSEEHYCEGIKRWTCSATVIRDPCTHSVVGVIDVSGLSATYNRQSLSLVVNTANQIETHLAQKELLLRYRLLDRCIAMLSSANGSMVLDRRGYAIKLNEHADAALTALGVHLDLRTPTQIGGMSGLTSTGSPESKALPRWLRAEWIEPIVENGEVIGSVIQVPHKPRPYRREEMRRHEGAEIAAEPEVEPGFANAIGNSSEFRLAITRAVRLARSRAPMLLLGETGAGKEVFARGIHESSPMRSGPFVALNCGGLSRDLLASELFGYREGAFTGSRRGGMAGKIEAADGGTLFLDEIGEMPVDLQPHFLRVLEDGQVARLGDNTPKKIHFRLISATNRNLRGEVDEGRFRMDLFYRISVTSLQLPALRQRKGDVPLLLDSFACQLCELHDLPRKRFDAGALAQLEAYAWPGNVRELRNVVESLVLTVTDELIVVDDLPAELQTDASRCGDSDPVLNKQRALQLQGLEKLEFEQICRALEESSGNATAAAQQLNIAKSTLYVKLKKYGLEEFLESRRH